jgi:hypothetical protein
MPVDLCERLRCLFAASNCGMMPARRWSEEENSEAAASGHSVPGVPGPIKTVGGGCGPGFGAIPVGCSMTFRVVHLFPAPEPGDSVLIDGRPHVVVSLLSYHAQRRPAARVSPDLPCRVCKTTLEYDPSRGHWWCRDCRTEYDQKALADLVAGHAAE